MYGNVSEVGWNMWCVQANPELTALWAVGQRIWQRDFPGIYSAIAAHQWSENILPVMEALRGTVMAVHFSVTNCTHLTWMMACTTHICGSNCISNTMWLSFQVLKYNISPTGDLRICILFFFFMSSGEKNIFWRLLLGVIEYTPESSATHWVSDWLTADLFEAHCIDLLRQTELLLRLCLSPVYYIHSLTLRLDKKKYIG